MKCPYCTNPDTRVIDSRPSEDGSTIRRRRLCENCQKRFTTYEKVETMPLFVIKKDQTRETFDREKLVERILRACHKRPVSVADIEQELQSNLERKISTVDIGEMVMARLKQVDEVAYVRFASVYRSFKDINTFMEELSKLLLEK